MAENIAVYCGNGHYIGTHPDPIHENMSPGRLKSYMHELYLEEFERQNYCEECGAETFCSCAYCHNPLLASKPKPSYCGKCGNAWPWTTKALDSAKQYTDELEGLSTEDKIALKATFNDLTTDTPRTGLAVSRFKKFIVKIGPAAGDILTKIIGNVVTEAAKKAMGL
jgi:hypothetical protein